MLYEENSYRQIFAIVMWGISGYLLIGYSVKSIQYAIRAARKDKPFEEDLATPIAFGIRVSVGVLLFFIGLILWFPKLISFAPCGLMIALAIGFLALPRFA